MVGPLATDGLSRNNDVSAVFAYERLDGKGCGVVVERGFYLEESICGE